MKTEIFVALIGSISTLLAAAIGAYATVYKDAETPKTSNLSGEDWKKQEAHRKKKAIGLIGMGLLLAVTVLVVGYLFGRAADKRKAELELQAEIGRQTKSYSSLVSQGLAAHRRYVIPAAIMLVTLERTPDGKSIASDRHLVYELQGLSDITKDLAKNADAFVEQYHSHYNVDQVAGADLEHIQEDRPGMKQWSVLFDLPSGERHSVVTGAHVVMPIDIKGPHPEHMFERLGPNEDAFCYPNSDGDVIEEFVIVVQSGSLEIYLPGDGTEDAELQRANQKISTRADTFVSVASTHRHISLVTRFKNLQKGDVVGLKVGWRTTR